MGKTLLGIDLDESPVGGLIESLLSEEDLEKLTDGGREPDEHADADDRSDDETADDETADDDSADSGGETDAADSGTDIVDDAVDSEDDAIDYQDDADSTTVPVETSDESADTPWETGSPSAASAGLDETVPTPEATTVAESESDSERCADDEAEADWRAKLRPLLLKATLALTVLAVIALVLYRYLDTAKSVAGDKLPTDRFGGEEDTNAAAPSDDGDVSPARRRAKAAGRDDTDVSTDADEAADEPATDKYSTRPVDEAVHDAEASTEARPTSSDEPDTVGRETGDSDVGALVGLAALALVAAVVRKVSEDRPRDPLVDGPADDPGDE
mgnify:CR=1 FL=1